MSAQPVVPTEEMLQVLDQVSAAQETYEAQTAEQLKTREAREDAALSAAQAGCTNPMIGERLKTAPQRAHTMVKRARKRAGKGGAADVSGVQ